MGLLDLLKDLGLEPKRCASTRGGEYHGKCPSCGGKDRFVVQPYVKSKSCEGVYFCRQCSIKGDSIKFCRDFFGDSFHFAQARLGLPSLGYQPTQASSFHNKEEEFVIVEHPNAKWMAEADRLVQVAAYHLKKNPDVLAMLERRGLPFHAVERYRLGYLPSRIEKYSRGDWGLDDEAKDLPLPGGVVIPSIDEGKIVRLKVRRSDWRPGASYGKYLAVSGSMKGFSIVGLERGSLQSPVMIIVESELDALALDWAVGDLVVAVSSGSNMKDPDAVASYWAGRKRLWICHDNDEAGLKMLEKWQRLFSHAVPKPTPIGKDIGEAIERGLNLRAWIENLTGVLAI